MADFFHESFLSPTACPKIKSNQCLKDLTLKVVECTGSHQGLTNVFSLNESVYSSDKNPCSIILQLNERRSTVQVKEIAIGAPIDSLKPVRSHFHIFQYGQP